MAVPRNLTLKTQEAIQDAHSLASSNGQQEISPLHLLASLHAQEDTIIPPLLKKINIDRAVLLSQTEKEIESLPKVSGGSGDVFASKELIKVLEKSSDEANKMRDSYVSTEHLLLALISIDSKAQKVLVDNNLDYNKLKAALDSVRGPHQVTDETPENKFQTLEKYSIDLTKRAREGKLDPVIGRDEEIRRVMQILSRRTKNNPVLIGEPGV